MPESYNSSIIKRITFMFDYSSHCGIEKNFITQSDLNKIVPIMKKFKPLSIPEGEVFGVDQNHRFYNWFMNTFFGKLKDYTNRQDLKLIFGMYANVTESFEIHRDIKQLPDSTPPNKHYASFLIPISVEDDVEKCKENCTYIFKNALLEEPEFNQPWHKNIVSSPDIPYYKLLKEIIWEPYSLIWWNSLYPHVGASLFNLNFSNKQMIVVHTYV